MDLQHWPTINVGMKGPGADIGPWAAPKDVKEPEDR